MELSVTVWPRWRPTHPVPYVMVSPTPQLWGRYVHIFAYVMVTACCRFCPTYVMVSPTPAARPRWLPVRAVAFVFSGRPADRGFCKFR